MSDQQNMKTEVGMFCSTAERTTNRPIQNWKWEIPLEKTKKKFPLILLLSSTNTKAPKRLIFF